MAKIALLVMLRYVEQQNKNFEIETFLSSLGELDLADFELFDKYPIKDLDQFINKLQSYNQEEDAFFWMIGLEGLASNIGSYSFFLQNSPNLRDLFVKSSQFSHVVSDFISKIAIENRSDQSEVTYHLSREALKLDKLTQSSTIEMTFGVMSILFREMLSLRDQKVIFHSAYEHKLTDESITKLLGHKFISNSESNCIVIPNEVMDMPNSKYEANLPPVINHGLSKHLEAYNEGSLVTIITNLLGVNPSSSLDDISHQLHISKRTLQRRLKDQKINFTTLKQNAANLRSVELLESNKHTIEEVAAILGYSSTATFVHAFTKWHGVSPSTYLKNK